MSEHRPAREALKGMEIAVPPGHDLPPQQSPDPYAQRPLPPIPPRSPARGLIPASPSSQQQDLPPRAPSRSPARASVSRPLAPPPEYWKLPRNTPTYNNSPPSPPIATGSRASGGHYRLDLPLPDPPSVRKRGWSIGGTKADSDLMSQSLAARSPTISPTLHNSPDKIRQMIGHDVNFDMGHPRVQSDTYDSTTYTAPASRASSSCYSNETVETTVSEPTMMSEEQQVAEYDDDPERTLVAEGFNFNPSPKCLPESPLSAHVDPLIIRRRAEVMSGEIRLHPAIHKSPRTSQPPASRHSHDSRRTSSSGAASKRPKKEDYVVKDLYHSTTAHIAASSKRRETREFPAPPPPKPTAWEPVSQAMGRLSFSPRVLASQKLHSAQRRASKFAGLPFSASTFQVGDRPARSPRPTSPPASAFDADDEGPSYMARVFRRSHSAEDGSPASGEARDSLGDARVGIQDFVAQTRRGAGLLTRAERRRASLRHKIRVIPEGERS